MKNLKLIILLLIIFNFSSHLNAEIKIKYKIDEYIITNIDILNEIKYLIFLRPNLSNIPEIEQMKISENSIVRGIIKKKELDKAFGEIRSAGFLEEIKKKLFKFKNVNNENDFKILIKKSGIEYDKVIEKMKYEVLWNQLITKKFDSFVRIDEKGLREKLKYKILTNKKYEYNLSELLFELDESNSLKKIYGKILDNIKNEDFRLTVSKYSISESAIYGGESGWIKETLLSNDLNNILGKKKIGDLTDPIKMPNGFLILKINDKREIKQKINIDKELKDLINYEKNKQLNQYSLLFYKKLKQNVKIKKY